MKNKKYLLLAAILCAGMSGCAESDCEDGVCVENYGVNPEFSVSREGLTAQCSIAVNGYGTVAMETEYVPNVTWCENGNAPTQALNAQAAAARTFAYYKISTGGTPVNNSQGDQVYKCESRSPSATQLKKCQDATAATSGYVMTYKGTVTAGFYVSGSTQSYLNSECKFTGGSSSAGWVSQQKYVTYNWGKSGTKANGFTQTSLGWVNDGNYANRGCMSQNGASCLANNGWEWMNILKFFYGADINIEKASGSCVTETKKCETKLSKSGTIIDDSDPCFSRSSTEAWWTVNSGYNNLLYYTYVWDKAAEAVGTWTVNVTRPGTYEVFAYIQSGVGAVSEKAPYVIRASGKNNSVSVNLNGKSGWVSLGKYTFASGGDQYVQLSDASGEPYTDKNGKRVLFDAIKFEDAATCTDACTSGAKQCSGNGYQTCTKGSNGCLAWSAVTACGANQKCQSGSCVATCTDACTSGAKQCSGNGYQTCTKGSNGCLAWSAVTACGTNQKCQSGSCVATCTDACTSGAKQCSGNGYQTCTKGSNGCLAWSAVTACGANQKCQSGSCVATCTDACTSGAKQCSGNGVQTCEKGSNGCLAWGAVTACSGAQKCQSGVCVDTCSDMCTSGAKRCSGNGVQTCAKASSGCLDWGSAEICGSGETCKDGACVKNGPACTNECNIEGVVCSGNELLECGQFDDDPCLDYKKTFCGEGNVCQDEHCVPEGTPCESTCSENTTKCQGDGYVSCVDENKDGCFAWSAVNPCSENEVCVAGSCEPAEPGEQPAECLTEIDGRPSVIIDDSDGCFTRNTEYIEWNVLKDYGYGNYMYYTPTTNGEAEAIGTWTLNVTKGGDYTIYAYLESGVGHATKNATYVVHASNRDYEVTVDMSNESGWYKLGNYTLKKGANQYVELTNETGEKASKGMRVLFDAIKVVPFEGEEPADEPNTADPVVVLQNPSCSSSPLEPLNQGGCILLMLGIAGGCLMRRRKNQI